MKKYQIVSLLLAAAMLLVLAPLSLTGAGEPKKDPVGMNIFGFSTTDLEGNVVTGEVLSEYQVTFMNFWATWCGPCTAEMPYIQQLYENYQSEGLNVLGLLSETGSCTVAGALAFCQQNGYTYPSLRLDSVLTGLVNNSGNAIPVSYVVDSLGNVLDYHVGSMSYNQLVQFVEPWMGEEPTGVAIDPDEFTLSVGWSKQLYLAYEPEDAMPLAATWTSSDNSIATVNSTGRVTAVSDGYVTITATLTNGLEATSLGIIGNPEPSDDPPTTPPATSQPPVTEPPVTEPPVTEPPVTEPPVTEPPVTEPPVTETPGTEPPGTQPPETPDVPTYDLGDVNKDGLINTGDAALVLRSTVGLVTLDEEQRTLADFNGDGVANTGDAAAILRFTVGL